MRQLFGTKLRYLRKQKKLSQSELARRAGLASYTHINHIEAGRRVPSLDLVVHIANVLGVTTDYLLRDTIPIDAPSASTITDQPDVPSPPFNEKLLYLRRQEGITQKDLMQQLGLSSQGYISKLESGNKEPSPELVVRIADTFEVSTDFLLINGNGEIRAIGQVKKYPAQKSAASEEQNGISAEE